MARRSPMVPVPFLDGPLAGIAQDVTPPYLCEGLRTVHQPLTADDIEADDPAGLFPNTRWHVYSAALVDSSEWPPDAPSQGPGDGGWGGASWASLRSPTRCGPPSSVTTTRGEPRNAP